MANKRLSATITIGGAIASSLRGALGSVTQGTQKVGAAVKALADRQRELNNVIKQQEGLGAKGSALRVQYANQELAVIGKQIEALKRRQAAERRISDAKAANTARRGELRAGIFDAVAVGATIGAPIASAVAFESAMLGIAKQVEGARDESGKLTAVYYDMGNAIKQMAREIPMTTTELAEMVTAGARMGVARDQLEAFTRTSAMMAEAFELPAGELADNMGKIAGLYKIPIPAIGSLADSINYLDDNAISKGGDIIDYLTRVGGVASSVKITGQQMAALGSTLLTLGERTETAGTATNAMFQKFAAADKGTKKFKSAMREIGLSTDKVQKGMQTDAMGTMLKVLDAVGKLKPEKQLGVMVELVGLEHSDTMAKLAQNTAELRKQLALANSEAAKGSMAREFSARLETTAAQAKIARNQLSILSTNIGTVLLPAVNSVLGPVGKLSETMANFAEANPGLTKAVVGTTVAVLGLGIAGKVAAYGFTFIKGGLLSVQGLLLRFGPLASAVLSPVGAVLRTVAVAALVAGTPIWAMVGAVVAVGAAVVAAGSLVYKYWEPLKAFFVGFGEGVMAAFAPLGAAITDAFGPLGTVIVGWVKDLWGWFTNLMTPIGEASKVTQEFGSVGKMVGETIGAAFRIALLPIEAIVRSISWLRDNIGGVITSLGNAWEKAKGLPGAVSGLFSSGSSAPASQAELDAAGKPAMARLPRPAMANRSGATSNDNSTHTYNITQQPGQDSKALADELEKRRRAQAGVRARSSLVDGAGAQ